MSSPHCPTCNCSPTEDELWLEFVDGRRISLGPGDAWDAFLCEQVPALAPLIYAARRAVRALPSERGGEMP